MNQGQGGWPMTVFLTPGAGAVLRRHLLPARRTATAGRASARCSSSSPSSGRTTATACASRRAELAALPARRARARLPARSVGEAELRARARPARAGTSTRAAAGSAARPSSRPPPALSLLLRLPPPLRRRAGARDGAQDARRDGRGRDVRPGGRRLPPLLRGRALAGAALREDALRQRAARRRSTWKGYQATGEPFYRRVAAEVLDYVLREMTSPEGGFYSATDADSEGEEGKFFVWTPDEIRAALGDEEEARRLLRVLRHHASAATGKGTASRTRRAPGRGWRRRSGLDARGAGAPRSRRCAGRGSTRRAASACRPASTTRC